MLFKRAHPSADLATFAMTFATFATFATFPTFAMTPLDEALMALMVVMAFLISMLCLALVVKFRANARLVLFESYCMKIDRSFRTKRWALALGDRNV